MIAVGALRATARDSRERSRPVVLAQFRLAEHSDTAFEFVVKNYGQSAARNVEVTFDPPLDVERRKQDTTQALAERWDSQVPLMPPGFEISNVYWSGTTAGATDNKLVNNLKTPSQVTVTITYKRWWRLRYKEVIPLDADWMGLHTHSTSSSSMPGRLKTISEALTTTAKQGGESGRELRDIGKVLGTDELGDSRLLQVPSTSFARLPQQGSFGPYQPRSRIR